MPKASSFSPLQLFSPIQLCFCLLLFFLPWVEVQCVPNPAARAGPPGAPREQLGPQTLASQSGLQLATGGVSMIDGPPQSGRGAQPNAMTLPKPDAAPLLFLFPAAVVLGIVFGFLPSRGLNRRLAVFSCCMLALGAVGVQAALGFPIKESTDKWVTGGGAAELLGDGEFGVRVAWSLFLYITLLFLIGAAGTAFLGGAAAPKHGRRADGPGRDDDTEGGAEPVKFPGASLAAGILLIIGGGLALALTALGVFVTVLAPRGGAEVMGIICFVVPPFIITLFGLMAGVRTVRGTSTEPIFNGVLGLLFGTLFGGIAAVLFLYGATAFGAGIGNAVGGMLMIFSGGFLAYGALFLVTGILLLVGRPGYVRWRQEMKARRKAAQGGGDEDDRPRRRKKKRQDDDSDDEDRPRRRPADEDDDSDDGDDDRPRRRGRRDD